MGLLQKRGELWKNEMISTSSVRYCEITKNHLLTFHPPGAFGGFPGSTSSVLKCRGVDECNEGDRLR